MKEIINRTCVLTGLLSCIIAVQHLSAQDFTSQQDTLHLKRRIYVSDNPKQTVQDILVDSVLTSFMQSPENCGISIAVYRWGKTSFYNYGETRKSSGIEVSETTLYEAGSVGATFCGLLLAKAIEEKKIDLEADIRMYLPKKMPALIYDKKPIQVKHLANHTSGLPHLPEDLVQQNNFDEHNPFKQYTKDCLYAYLASLVLTQKPGSASSYSGLGLALLACILEEVYQDTFENLIRQKVSDPLTLNHAGYDVNCLQMQNFAVSYTDDGNPVQPWNLQVFQGVAGLKISSAGLLKYLMYHLEGDEAALTYVKTTTFSAAKEKLGLVWYIKNTKQGNTLFYQSGGTIGSSGFSGFVPEKNCAVAILSNSERNVEYIALALLNYLQQ